MHRIDDSKFLLYIEPKASEKSTEPVNDEIAEIVEICLNNAKTGTANYSNLDSNKGIHGTECGEKSSNKDYLLGNGMITNSLCVFYLKYYRNSIPESEMKKVLELCNWAKENNYVKKYKDEYGLPRLAAVNSTLTIEEIYEKIGFDVTEVSTDDWCYGYLPDGWTVKRTSGYWYEIRNEEGIAKALYFKKVTPWDKESFIRIDEFVKN